MKLSATLTLALAVILGVLEYLNQQTFGFPAVWYEVFKFTILLISTFGVTAAVGRQLGMDIRELLHLSPAAMTVIGSAALVLAGAVSTFGIGGIAKGIVLGVVAFLTATFGPFPTNPVVKPAPSPAPPAA